MSSRAARIAVLVGIVALALNLRPAAVSVGPELARIRAGLGMSPTSAGVLTTLPVLAFAVFGALAPRVSRAVGVHRTAFAALLLVAAGLAGRAWVGETWSFLLLSVVALAGMAAANVLLPSLVKLHFPTRIGLITSIYTTALAIGLTLATAVTVPISEAAGSWRWGLFAWAVVAGLAALPWVGLLVHDQHGGPRTGAAITFGQVARTRLGWAMALCFGLQSLQAYAVFGWFAEVFAAAGHSSTEAGLLLGVVTGVSIPISVWVPSAAARRERQTGLFAGLLSCYVVGYLGLIVAPEQGTWLWAVLVGIGAGVFPLVLTLIGLRARTDAGTAALSGFTQSVGYLLAGFGPFAIGVVYEATGGWTWPVLLLLALVLPLAVACLYVARPAFIEDQLPSASTAGPTPGEGPPPGRSARPPR